MNQNIKPTNDIGVKFIRYSANNKKKYVCECPICGCEFEIFASKYYQNTNNCPCKWIARDNPRLYGIWENMKSRCYNKNVMSYKNYGAKGITVCDEWNDSFKSFYDWAIKNGYSEELTLDRIDVTGNYEPSNCRWATTIQQANNKTNNIFVDGVSLKRYCALHGLNYKTEHTFLSRHGYEELLIRLEKKKRAV